MLIKYTGKYVNIYFIMKITYHSKSSYCISLVWACISLPDSAFRSYVIQTSSDYPASDIPAIPLERHFF